MLDLKLIRQEPEAVKAGAKKKRIPCDVDRILEIDAEWRELGREVDQLRGEQKSSGKAVAQADAAERPALLERQKGLKTTLKAKEERLSELKMELDALLLTGGTSLRYFSNIGWGLSERLFALVMPQSGAAFVVCPAFEEDRAREQLALGPFGDGTAVLTGEEHGSPYLLVADGLRTAGVSAGRLGIEETVRFVFSDGVAQVAENNL